MCKGQVNIVFSVLKEFLSENWVVVLVEFVWSILHMNMIKQAIMAELYSIYMF